MPGLQARGIGHGRVVEIFKSPTQLIHAGSRGDRERHLTNSADKEYEQPARLATGEPSHITNTTLVRADSTVFSLTRKITLNNVASAWLTLPTWELPTVASPLVCLPVPGSGSFATAKASDRLLRGIETANLTHSGGVQACYMLLSGRPSRTAPTQHCLSPTRSDSLLAKRLPA